VAVSLAWEPGKKPPLMVIHRRKRWQLLNEQEVVRAAEAMAVDLRSDVPVVEQAWVVNSFDVLLGIHGAGLTSAVFLPPGAVVIQVVPYGKLDHMENLQSSTTQQWTWGSSTSATS
jgi:capsular polysaccharide biosynthesis protein